MQEERRLASIDALRGTAIILMLLHHFPLFLLEGYQESEVFTFLFVVSRFAAPLFLFIAGVSMVLSAERRAKQAGAKNAASHIAKRGLVLVAGGFLLSILINEPIGRLNVLHTIGLSMILLMPLALTNGLLILALSLLFFVLLAAAAPEIPEAESALGLFGFPPLPWTVYVLFGIFFGRYLARQRRDARKTARLLEYASLSSMMSAAALTAAGLGFGFDTYATAPFIALSMGFLLYACSLAFWIYEAYGRNPVVLRPFVAYGRHAFSIYFIHQIFIATIPGLIELRNTFSLAETGAALALFLILAYVAISRMEK